MHLSLELDRPTEQQRAEVEVGPEVELRAQAGGGGQTFGEIHPIRVLVAESTSLRQVRSEIQQLLLRLLLEGVRGLLGQRSIHLHAEELAVRAVQQRITAVEEHAPHPAFQQLRNLAEDHAAGVLDVATRPAQVLQQQRLVDLAGEVASFPQQLHRVDLRRAAVELGGVVQVRVQRLLVRQQVLGQLGADHAPASAQELLQFLAVAVQQPYDLEGGIVRHDVLHRVGHLEPVGRVCLLSAREVPVIHRAVVQREGRGHDVVPRVERRREVAEELVVLRLQVEDHELRMSLRHQSLPVKR